MTDKTYLDSFNPPQRAAVEYNDGASLVIAGAGSGKTRVLTYKIAYLMENGMEPWNILALTFTNKAANEMKERIAKIVGTEASRQLWMGTFHSIFLRILRIEHEYIGFSSNFTIYDASDSKSLVKNIIKEMELDDKEYKAGEVLNTISNSKNRLVTAEQYLADSSAAISDTRKKMPETGHIYQRYANRCKQADAMDFDDILLYTYLLFEQNPSVREKWENRFHFVLVDEYQDTNYAQHRIVWQLTQNRQKVCVVGDDAQSIYSFRGANIDNILTFQDAYKGAKLFKLEQNYRSTQNIVEAANSLIGKNKRQIQKQVFSENNRGEKLHLINTHSDIEESIVVVKNIKRIKRAEGGEYSDFAILYRTNAQSRVFEDTLRKEGMPYRIFGGLSFYQRKEIKDVIAYFRLVINQNDEEAFRRVINYPARGIGNTTIAKITQQANAHNVSLWTIIKQPQAYGLDVNKGTAAKLCAFASLIESFVEEAETAQADEIGKKIMHDSGIIQDIYKDATPENLARQENIEELLNSMQEFCSSRIEEGDDHILLSDYISEVSLISDMDTDKGDDEHKVTLMTVHSAKGLEFKNVFVVGMEEGLFPSDMVSGSMRGMEEERRLFYVAITRAKTRCYLTFAQSRYRFGKTEYSAPSRFLDDIDSRYIDREATFTSSHRSNDDSVELPWLRRRPFTPSTPSASPAYPQRPTASAHPQRTTAPAPPAGNLRRVAPTPAPPATHASSPAQSTSSIISIGTRIEHSRFGIGEVINVEGTGDNLKATVKFEHLGTKQLLMKFAKYNILK